MLFPTLFLVGRVLFAIGYILGYRMNILQLRAMGFAINLLSIFLVLAEINGIAVINKYFR